MTNINFLGFENRVQTMIVNLLENPIKQMTGYDTIIERMNIAIQRNIRRTHELDFITQKYSRAASIVDSF